MRAGGTGRVLYPASCKASTELQDGLAASGFTVTRLDTYDTVRGARARARASLSGPAEGVGRKGGWGSSEGRGGTCACPCLRPRHACLACPPA